MPFSQRFHYTTFAPCDATKKLLQKKPCAFGVLSAICKVYLQGVVFTGWACGPLTGESIRPTSQGGGQSRIRRPLHARGPP